jgi:hypothetical protein
MSAVEISHRTIYALSLQTRILVTSPKLVVELSRGVDREKFLYAIELAGCASDAIPVEREGREAPLHIEDHSYFFHKPHEAGI